MTYFFQEYKRGLCLVKDGVDYSVVASMLSKEQIGEGNVSGNGDGHGKLE